MPGPSVRMNTYISFTIRDRATKGCGNISDCCKQIHFVFDFNHSHLRSCKSKKTVLYKAEHIIFIKKIAK